MTWLLLSILSPACDCDFATLRIFFLEKYEKVIIIMGRDEGGINNTWLQKPEFMRVQRIEGTGSEF